jgi:hypothetical protein
MFFKVAVSSPDKTAVRKEHKAGRRAERRAERKEESRRMVVVLQL